MLRHWVRPPPSNSGKLLSLYIHPQKKHNCLEASGVSSFWGSQLFSRFGSFGSPGFRFQNLAFGVSRFWGPQLFRRFGHSEYPV